MTLVELMVVVAIIGILSVVVLPLLANSSEGRKTREAARSLVSYVARSQTRVLGRTEWGGFWIVPVTNANYALDVFSADVPKIFQGDTFGITVTGSALASGTFDPSLVTTVSATSLFYLTSGSIGGTAVSGSIGDLVRFDGTGPWFVLSSTSGTSIALRAGGTFNGTSVEQSNQTVFNTPWPTSNVAHTYELMRQPIRSGTPLTFGDGRCIDVAQSGYLGPSGYEPFGNNPASIAVLFDGTGRLRQLVVGATRKTPTGAVFLLVGRADRAGNAYATLDPKDDSVGANWQYGDCYWIGIDPLTGVAKVAECVPNATSVVASQAHIRSELLATGR